MAVLLSGSLREPQLLICREILLSDPTVPGSKQPYHAALQLPEKEGRAITHKLCKAVSAAAEKSVAELLEEANAARYKVRGGACVVGSLVDPAKLHNEHIRAHGLEGQLFRSVLEEALGSHRIPCAVLLERGAYEAASPVLGMTSARVKRAILKLGESRNGSWRAEEKLACLAAWFALVRFEGTRQKQLV